MKTQNQRNQSLVDCQRNMRRTQAAIDAVAGKMKDLEKKEAAFQEFKKRIGGYFDEYLHVHAGTSELKKLDHMKTELHEQTVKINKGHNDERTSLKAEQKRLYSQEEEYRRKYRAIT